MKKQSIKLWAVAVWLLVWEAAALLLNKEIFLVSPVRAITRFCELAVTGGFWLSVFGSFARIAVGFLLAVAVGINLAALSSKHKLVRDFISPIMLCVKAVPIASFIILMLICFSSKYLAVIISFMIVVPTIYENVFTGITETSTSLLEMARTYNLSAKKTRRYIYIPQIHPYFKAACKTAVGMAWKAGVAAEVIGTPKGSIGAMLNQAKIYLETADLLAWTIGVVLLSLLMEKVVLLIIEKVGSGLLKLPAQSGQGKETAMTTQAEQLAEDKQTSEHAEEHTAMTVQAAAIELQNINKSYGDQKVLSDVSFVFPSGKTSAIMAPSGGGKTTLLRIIAGLEKADSGDIIYRPQPVSVMFQEDRLLEYMTAEENIRLVSESISAEDARRAMEEVGLTESECGGKTVKDFSGGMRRRVALLRALLHAKSNPAGSSVLILDEPFKGLDEETKRITIDYIKKIAKGVTLIIITHEREEAEALGATNYLELQPAKI